MKEIVRVWSCLKRLRKPKMFIQQYAEGVGKKRERYLEPEHGMEIEI